MGTTAQKLNRVLQTKSDLKTVINYSGANITNETTFKDYPKLLNKAYIDILNDEGESLYNALPKTTGTGTSIDLDVEKGKMKIDLNSTEIEQVSTSGNNLIKFPNIAETTVNGITYSIQDNVISLNGTATDNVRYIYASNFAFNGAGDYRITLIPVSGNYTSGVIGISSRTEDKATQIVWQQVASGVMTNKKTYTAENISQIKNIGIYINSGSVLNNLKFKLMFTKGDTTPTTYEDMTSPTPDNPQDIHVITGSNNIKISDGIQEQNYPIDLSSYNMIKNGAFDEGTLNWIKTNNWNIVKENNIWYAKLSINTNGFDQLYQTLPTINGHKYYISLLNKTNIKLNAMQRVILSTSPTANYPSPNYDIPLNTTEELVSTIIEATGDNASVGIKTQYYNQTGDVEFYVRNFLCVDLTEIYGVGNEPTLQQCDERYSYLPYIENPIEYCKIGDYADQFFKNTTDSEFYDSTLLENEWYLKKNITKNIFDGSTTKDDYVYSSDLTDVLAVNMRPNRIDAPAFKYDFGIDKSSIFSNKFKYKWSTGNEEHIYITGATQIPDGFYGNIRLYINHDRLNGYSSSLTNAQKRDLLQNWLSVNPLTVYFIARYPVTIHISETDYPTLYQQLENIYNNVKSYDGVTHITQTNDDLPFNLEVSALAKIE